MSLPRGARRIRDAFERAAAEGRTALVAYLVAGHPDDDASMAAAETALESGADLLEIGVPFSDPVADGPVIAAAAHGAVAAGGGVDGALRLARGLRERGHDQPLLAMGYLNPLVARGPGRTLRELAGAGVDGLIVPDLPAAEDRQLEREAAAAGLAMCFLVSPNTSPERMERAIRASTGFLYVVPLLGVTGARDEVARSAGPLLKRIGRAAAGRLPVAVGFGISRPEHVRQLGRHADGVVVGSAVVAAMEADGPAGVARLVGVLASAAGRPALLGR
jgi:tryptophan synthase alpha chain